MQSFRLRTATSARQLTEHAHTQPAPSLARPPGKLCCKDLPPSKVEVEVRTEKQAAGSSEKEHVAAWDFQVMLTRAAPERD